MEHHIIISYTTRDLTTYFPRLHEKWFTIRDRDHYPIQFVVGNLFY